jgi:hypothetical protein
LRERKREGERKSWDGSFRKAKEEKGKEYKKAPKGNLLKFRFLWGCCCGRCFPLLRRIVWLIFVEYFESLLAHS